MVKKRKIWNLSSFDPKTSNLYRGSDPKSRTPVTPVSSKKTISSSNYKTIFLHDWWLVKAQDKGLAVGGVASMERLGERVIFSTPIAKRHESNVLETQDGITVIVSGFINMARMHENGFSLQICRYFLLGFPHNWEEYIPYGLGEEYNNGNTGFGDSNTCPLKSADNALPFIIDDNIHATEIPDLFSNNVELNCCWLPKKVFNDALGNYPENVSKQSDPADSMECNITMNTKESEGKEVTNLVTSPQQVDQMHNCENGVSDVVVETQDENPKFGFESEMNMNFPEPCGSGLSGRSMEKAPVSSKKKKKDSSSSVRKEKISGEASNPCRRVTRSISKMSHISANSVVLESLPGLVFLSSSTSRSQMNKKITGCINSPVRRSTRLCNLRSHLSGTQKQ